MKKIFTFLPFFILFISISQAEGIKEMAPNDSIVVNGVNTTDIAALLINHEAYGSFASLDNTDETSRLFINIQDPTKECIYLGFSKGHLNFSTPNPPAINFTFVIKDPAGNIVYGPELVTPNTANINNWQHGMNGPAPLTGSNGYIPIEIDNASLSATGWTGAGDYYIEFDAGTSGGGFLIDFWDITVVDCENSSPVEKKGRVWSYNWALFAINDYGFPERPFNGAFYTCAPDNNSENQWFINKVDFNGSGFMPAAFNIAFNSFGTRDDGDIIHNRRSVQNANTTKPEYPIFLNDPVDIYETAEQGAIEFSSITSCQGTETCINVIPSNSGQIDILIDLDGDDGVYTDNSADVLLSYDVPDSLAGHEICIPWGGLDGNGNQVDNENIPIVIWYNQGIYHFPVYDAELMLNGFNISRTRPAGPSPLLYYDDSEIDVEPGTGEPKVNLSGCTTPCHTWSTYIHPDIPGYGNMNTINSWWFATTAELSLNIAMPNTIECQLTAPEEICVGDIDTIFVQLDTIGPGTISNPIVQWDGASIVESNDEYAIIQEPGTYTYTLSYINNTGEECSTTCEIRIANCCSVEMHCPRNTGIFAVKCPEEVPDILTDLEDFLEAGFDFGDTACLILVAEVEEVSNNGSGCINDPLIIQRTYNLFNDINSNGVHDEDEEELSCLQIFSVLDTAQATFEITHPMLEDIESGDTLRIQCDVNNIDEGLPDLSVDDLAYANICGTPVIEFNHSLVAKGSCSDDGFMAQYLYEWNIKDNCDNNYSYHFIVEVVDTIAPQFLTPARDTTIYCADALNLPTLEYEDECCCASLEYADEYGDCDEDIIKVTRTWTLKDQCGNTSELIETINLIDTSTLRINFVNNRYINGEEIQVECYRGGLPHEVLNWDENAVEVSSGCSQVDIIFNKKILHSGSCTDGVKQRWEFSWTAINSCGQKSTFIVFVNLVDNTPPEIIIPENLCNGFPDPDNYHVRDNCSGSEVKVSVIELENPACPDVIQKEYTYTATDLCGNTSQVKQIYSQGKIQAPTIRLKNYNLGADSTITINCNSDKEIARIYSRDAVEASSTCSEITGIYFAVVSSTEGTCSDGIFKTDILRWVAVDICGNTSKIWVTINYIDTSPPTIDGFKEEIWITCPTEIPVYDKLIDCNLATILADDIQYSDDCSSNGIAERDITVEDICGNTATYKQKIHIDRSLSMEIVNRKEVICADDNDMAPILYDYCYDTLIPATLITVEKIDECNEYFDELRIWEIENICGIKKILKQKVLKGDAPEPEISIHHDEYGAIAPGSIIQLDCEKGHFGEENFSFDNPCNIFSYSLDIKTLQSDCINKVAYSEEYTLTLTDPCGRIFITDIIVEYLDNTPPTFTDIPADLTLSCADELPDDVPKVQDNCSAVNVDYNEIPFTETGKPGYTKIWIAKDACGNTSTAQQVIEISGRPNCYIDVPDHIDCWSSTEIEVFVSGGTEPYLYKWEVVNGECLINQSSDSPRVEVTILSDSAEVKVIVIDADGCETECSVVLECDGAQSRENVPFNKGSAYANAVKLFPNPSVSSFNIEAPEDVKELIIYASTGQKVKSYKPNKSIFSLRHDLISGIYFVELKTEGTVYYKKIHVEH